MKPKYDDITIGIEQEFFLLAPPNGTSTSVQSEIFFSQLLRQAGWRATHDAPMNVVAFVEATGRDTIIKHDHHPHLLEIALDYSPSIHDLATKLKAALAAVRRAAREAGLEAAMLPHLAIPASDPRLCSPLPFFKMLRHTRRTWRHRKGLPGNPAAENYAAVIAANQVHLGGISWLDHTDYIEALYSFEPHLAGFAFEGWATESDEKAAAFQRRWSGYVSAFPSSPLVGFPPGERWSLGSYREWLAVTPLAGSEDEFFAGWTTSELELPLPEDLLHSRVRDLQLIKPRSFGTVEFRADPCQPDVDHVCAMASLRLGLAVSVIEGARSPWTYRQAGDCWRKMVSGDQSVPAVCGEVLRLSKAGLVSRGLGEEVFLAPFTA